MAEAENNRESPKRDEGMNNHVDKNPASREGKRETNWCFDI
ncbi:MULTISPECIES: hypothetical protein [Geobacillus]|nr:hypothetical protein [Geobacillus sp. 46C-IIa]